MRRVVYMMNVSADGYITAPAGGIDWSVPSDEVFRFHIQRIRGVDVHLLGRKLYETMLYWETAADQPGLSDDELEWTRLWNALPKVVFSRTLNTVIPSARLATGSLEDEIRKLKAEPGDGEIAIGGANLAAQAAALDLIDEYAMIVSPVLVGGGIPYFPQDGRLVTLEMVDAREFGGGFSYRRYAVRR
ncbi:MAG: dihydrofolate reductase family protein [Actinomycetes bacterium]|jgi:dihydrofolate reductase|nr:MAG: deaminase [Actinomycetota bacterium]